jgi:thiol-disulfide isomerase/thioredoxin
LPWIVDANDDTFAELAEKASVPVVVDLWAPWCGPCRMVSPALAQVAEQLAGRVKLVKVNVDKLAAAAAALRRPGHPDAADHPGRQGRRAARRGRARGRPAGLGRAGHSGQPLVGPAPV